MSLTKPRGENQTKTKLPDRRGLLWGQKEAGRSEVTGSQAQGTGAKAGKAGLCRASGDMAKPFLVLTPAGNRETQKQAGGGPRCGFRKQ